MVNWMKPIWTGDTVYEETVIYIKGSDGCVEAAPLLYQPEKILKVASCDGKTLYEEGRDYQIGDRALIRMEGSAMPLWEYDEYYLTEPGKIAIQSIGERGRYIRFDRGDVFAAQQVMVTYTHKDSWRGPKPVYKGDRLLKTVEILKSDQLLRIVYFGDSLMAGCDCSSFWSIEPMMPPLCDLITEELKKVWNHPHIWTINTAVGGKTASWAITQVKERIVAHRPHLIIFDFGVNDTRTRPRVFQEQLREMVRAVQAELPEAEFLFMTPMIVNPDAMGWTRFHPYYFWGAQELEEEIAGFAAVPTSMFASYILANKRFEDVTGNGVNHPNDFLARVYAQITAAALIPHERK